MTPRLVVYGDIVIDVLVQFQAAPSVGHDVTADHISLIPGGSAANCAVTAARLGMAVDFVGVTGSDHLAQALVDDLRVNSVGTRYLRQTEAPTAIIVDMVNADGERTFYSFRGAITMVRYGAIPPELIGPQDHLHVSAYTFQDECSRETALALMARARERGATISLDPSVQFAREVRDRPPDILADLDFIFPNSDEAGLMSGRDDPRQGAAAIRDLGPKTVVVKLGPRGCYIASDREECFVPAYPATEVVDTTGAGDAFCGGFLMACLHGLELTEAARVGHAAAVHVIAQRGGHSASPTLDDVIRFVSQHGDEELASRICLLKGGELCDQNQFA